MRYFPLSFLLLLWVTAVTAAEPWIGTMKTTPATSLNLTLTLGDGLSATIRVHHPTTSTEKCPVIIFSHGLAGSREGYEFLGKCWAEHGYVVIHPDHPGSDTAAFKGKPLNEITAALRAATTDVKVLTGRPELIRALIDHLSDIEKNLKETTLDPTRIGVAGHSFGAWTTMAVAGVTGRFPGMNNLSDPRPRAFAALSPSGPTGEGRAKDYAACTRPILVMTGSEDRQPAFLNPGGPERSGAWRRQVFDLIPAGDKMLAWFDGARHCTYSNGAGNVLSGEPLPDATQVHAVTIVTLAWWDAYLRDDEKAKSWLKDPLTPTALGTWAKFERR